MTVLDLDLTRLTGDADHGEPAVVAGGAAHPAPEPAMSLGVRTVRPRRLHSALLGVLVMALPAPTAPAVDEPAAGHASSPQITIISTSPEWTRRIEWGLERFARADLTLPPMTVTVHDGTEPCGGNSGRFRPGPPAEVHVCTQTATDSPVARLITLHELAHAWAETQLAEADKDALVDLRGLDAWIDQRVPRHEWGAEHAAEVVSWGLMDEELRIIRVDDAEPAALTTAFDLLVHRAPLWRTTA